MTIITKIPHLYVTRTAVLGYQEVMGGGFEAIRRKITTSLLHDPRPDPEHDDCFLLDAWDDAAMTYRTFRVYTIEDGPLLVVPKVELARHDA